MPQKGVRHTLAQTDTVTVHEKLVEAKDGPDLFEVSWCLKDIFASLNKQFSLVSTNISSRSRWMDGIDCRLFGLWFV